MLHDRLVLSRKLPQLNSSSFIALWLQGHIYQKAFHLVHRKYIAISSAKNTNLLLVLLSEIGFPVYLIVS